MKKIPRFHGITGILPITNQVWSDFSVANLPTRDGKCSSSRVKRATCASASARDATLP